jgi:signal transduction histidine kinase
VLESGKPFPRPSLDVETTLFRVAQEALNNVVKHAHASQVILQVEAERGLIRLSVADDGQGFDPSEDAQDARDEKVSGWGMVSMRERIEAIGGTLRLTSRPGRGTQIVVEIPDLAPGALKGVQGAQA